MGHKSQSYVDFVGGLMPLYQHEQVAGEWCARSLRDGTLLLPRRENDQEEGDSVTVWWQGDRHRANDVDGTHLASIALMDYVRFHCAGKPHVHLSNLLEDLTQHFAFKTGGSLYLPYAEEELDAFGKVLDTVKRYGPDLAWEALKKGFGL